MNDFDLNVLRSLRNHGRSGQLADRICASLGQPPRRLPSRTALAVESMSWRVAAVATVIAVVALTARTFSREMPPSSGDAILANALSGELPRADQVYAWMAGVTPMSEAQR